MAFSHRQRRLDKQWELAASSNGQKVRVFSCMSLKLMPTRRLIHSKFREFKTQSVFPWLPWYNTDRDALKSTLEWGGGCTLKEKRHSCVLGKFSVLKSRMFQVAAWWCIGFFFFSDLRFGEWRLITFFSYFLNRSSKYLGKRNKSRDYTIFYSSLYRLSFLKFFLKYTLLWQSNYIHLETTAIIHTHTHTLTL